MVMDGTCHHHPLGSHRRVCATPNPVKESNPEVYPKWINFRCPGRGHICPFLPLSAELEVTEKKSVRSGSFFTYATCSAAGFASFCVMDAARSMTEMRGGTSSVMRRRLIVYPSTAASCVGMSSPDEAAMVPAISQEPSLSQRDCGHAPRAQTVVSSSRPDNLHNRAEGPAVSLAETASLSRISKNFTQGPTIADKPSLSRSHARAQN